MPKKLKLGEWLSTHPIVVVMGIAASLLAFWGYFADSHTKDSRADELFRGIVQGPDNQYQSSINVLSNGLISVRDAASGLRPPPTKQELDILVERWAMQGKTGTQINERLAGEYGTGRLSKLNNALSNAAEKVDKFYADLASCYRQQNCGKGAEFRRMCEAVNRILTWIEATNNEAKQVPGLTFNDSGSPTLFGSGTLDRYFYAINVPNLNYLSIICAG